MGEGKWNLWDTPETWDVGGPRESMGVTLVETLNSWAHGDKKWPPPAARHNFQWKDKKLTQNAYKMCGDKDRAKMEGMANQ